jgi:hypothetical protein
MVTLQNGVEMAEKKKPKKKVSSKALQSQPGYTHPNKGKKVHNWELMRKLFVEGVPTKMDEPDGDREWLTLKEVSERMNVGYKTLSVRASKERWTSLKQAYQTSLAIERQKKRAQKLGKDAVEFDEKSLKIAQLGIGLVMTRYGEIVQEVTAKKAIREEALAKQQAGVPVDREDLWSAIRYGEMESLARAAVTLQEIGNKALGNDTQKLQIEGTIEHGHSISVNAELAREDKGRIAGVLAVMNRMPEFREIITAELEDKDYIEGELVEDLPESEYEEEDEES